MDLAIIGAGPAGLSLACAVRNSPVLKPLAMRIFEYASLNRLANWNSTIGETYENRVSSLTPRSVAFLERIGAWPHINHDRVKPYDEMRVWDGVSGAFIDFDPFTLGQSNDIAYMVENSNLQQALYHRLLELDGKDCISEGKLELSKQHGLPVITTELDGQKASSTARLLVGADGQNSIVRNFAEIVSRGWDYNRFGVVASLGLEYDNYRNVAYQRFLPSGPIALLPLPDLSATLVWSTTPERAAFLKQLKPTAFCAMVNAGFRLEMVDLDYLFTMNPANTAEIIDQIEWRLQQLTIEDEENTLPVPIAAVVEKTVAAFPLKMKHADTYIGDRVALVGDAAHTTHPLAGQGLNMGQRDVEYLVDALELAVQRGLDIGSSLALEPYWKSAYAPNHVKLGVVDKLHKLYSTDCWPIVQLRSAGLSAVNQSEWVKKFLMSQASN